MTGWVYPPTVPLSPIRTVAPTVNPVSLEEAKDHVGAAEFDDDDRKIESYLDAAVAYIDGYLRAGPDYSDLEGEIVRLAVRWNTPSPRASAEHNDRQILQFGQFPSDIECGQLRALYRRPWALYRVAPWIFGA
jgi:hypothetical protein